MLLCNGKSAIGIPIALFAFIREYRNGTGGTNKVFNCILTIRKKTNGRYTVGYERTKKIIPCACERAYAQSGKQRIPMTMNLRADDKFVQDSGWYAACERYENFIEQHKNKRIVYLELGVGGNTPVIIKYPFWRFTMENPKATYICINYGEAICPPQIEKQSICINEDIGAVFTAI